MICNRCGKENHENAKFCIGCGNNLTKPIFNNMNPVEQVNNGLYNSNINNEVVRESAVNNLPQEHNGVKETKKVKKPINKKLLLIVGAVLLTLIVGVLLVVFVFNGDKKSKDLNSIFDLNTPIPVYKDGMYVYIDTNGKTIKNVRYYRANDFNGDYAYVELEDGTAALIDKNQNIKVKATSYYGMEYLSSYDLWLIDGVLYNNKLKPLTDDSISLDYEEYGFFTYSNSDYTEYGIINSKGKKIYKNNCLITSLDINNDSYEGEYYGVLETTCTQNEEKIENEYLIELQTGKILYENEYKKQHPDSYYYYLYETDDNMFYVVDENYDKIERFYLKNNKIVYSTKEILYGLTLYGNKHLRLDYGYNYDSEEVGKEQRYYYYNLDTKKLEKEEPKLEEIDVVIEKDINKRQIVECDYGEGLIDAKNVIIPCIYNDIEYLSENVHDYMEQVKSMDLFIVEDDNGQKSIYDANKKQNIITFEKSKKSSIEDYQNSLFIQQKIYVNDSWYSDVDKKIIYNILTREKITFDKNSSIEIKTNYFTESKNGKKIYYNMNFEKIYTEN